MKRILSLLLTLLLCCALVGPLSSLAEEDGPRTQAGEPFLLYDFYEQDDWETLSEGTMFQADLDQDGQAEPVSFVKDPETWTTLILWNNSPVLLEGDELVEAAVLDLDPESPFYNLLVTIDYGSDSYVTVELHPENGELVRGNSVGGGWYWEDGLYFFERTDFLGTADGQRTYSTDELTPDSEWLTMSYVPSEEEMADEEEREFLIDGGLLLHTVQAVPCAIDGAPGTIPADSYVYRTRFHAGDYCTEVCLADGTLAQISCTMGENGWPFLIDGQEADAYFDNLFYAD